MMPNVASERELGSHRDGRQTVKLRFTTIDQTSSAQWRDLLGKLAGLVR
jgi:hypothetical protein